MTAIESVARVLSPCRRHFDGMTGPFHRPKPLSVDVAQMRAAVPDLDCEWFKFVEDHFRRWSREPT